MQVKRQSPLVYTIPNFLTSSMCEYLISLSENIGYTSAPITIDASKGIYEFNEDIRNNSRVIVDNELSANFLFHQLKDKLPLVYKEIWKLKGLNSRFRFYKYQKGQTFKPHLDGKYKESSTCESKLSLLIFLSEDFKGGHTMFEKLANESKDLSIKPSIGQVLIFDHHQMHSGDIVLDDGIKYVLRTDVMYTRSN